MSLIATDFHDVKTPFASQLSDELQVQQEYFILKYIKSNVEFDPILLTVTFDSKLYNTVLISSSILSFYLMPIFFLIYLVQIFLVGRFLSFANP